MTPAQWRTIHDTVAWLDRQNTTGDHETAMRIMKVTEEAGEAAPAYIGMAGQNPRKGVTHTPDDVAGELADVILSAAVALATVVGEDAERVFAGRLDAVTRRRGAA